MDASCEAIVYINGYKAILVKIIRDPEKKTDASSICKALDDVVYDGETFLSGEIFKVPLRFVNIGK